MKIDLCRLFGVEEGEEFKVEYEDHISDLKYRIMNNLMEWSEIGTKYEGVYNPSCFSLNEVNKVKNIIKLPKKKQFTDDELCILRNIESEINTLGRNINGTIYVTSDYGKSYLKLFNNLFQSLDIGEEIIIDDYVER